ncbi:MAG: short-chain fatty acyl-CoA regulator family protein [Alphaproteobacteria bacterium]
MATKESRQTPLSRGTVKPALGASIRRLRRRKGLSQVKLAQRLEISPSYLNLIEGGRRNVTVPLLFGLSQHLGVGLAELAPGDEGQLAADLIELFADDLFEDHDLTTSDVRDLVGAAPAAGRAMLTLYDAYRKTRQDLASLVDGDPNGNGAGNEVPAARLPAEQVSDFIQAERNHFPSLEDAAERVARDIRLSDTDAMQGMTTFLANAFGVRVATLQPGDGRAIARHFDRKAMVLEISESLPPASRQFQLAHQIGLLAAKPEIDGILEQADLSGDDTLALTRIALANYFAATLLMPYEDFLMSARRLRYDIDLLAHRFGSSFEQVCHRLTTLRRDGASGVPFHMLRTDIAGNISKRLSLSGIHIPRHGAACPRWNVYAAFLRPGAINVQLSRMPDGRTYFCIARAIEKAVGGYHAQHTYHSICLGCEIGYARELVYADGIDLEDTSLAVPIGASCRICERMDCRQRAFPPVAHRLNFDENTRGLSAYVSAD